MKIGLRTARRIEIIIFTTKRSKMRKEEEILNINNDNCTTKCN